MSAVPSPAQVRAQVSEIRRRKDPADQIIAIRYPGVWSGPSDLQVDGEVLPVLHSQSPLEIRDRLAMQGHSGQPLVILTSLSDVDLGEDVLARLSGGRLRHVQRWQLLADLFKIKATIDPRIERWLADALIEGAPASGYTPAASGTLDLDTASRTLLRDQFGLRQDRPDLAGLLQWTNSAPDAQRFRDASAEVRRGAAMWLGEAVGEAAIGVLAMVEQGTASDAVPAGLVCSVLYAPETRDDLTVREAAIRLERTRGGHALNATAGDAWGRVAVDLLRRSPDDQRRAWVHRAELLLAEVGARDWAWVAGWSPSGFEQHLARYARELTGVLNSTATRAGGRSSTATSLEGLTSLAGRVATYDAARVQGDRALRVTMSLRLARWLTFADDSPAATFAVAAERHLRDAAFVDRARGLLRDGDEIPALAAAYRSLREAVGASREAQNQRFASLLHDWPGAAPDEHTILPIERALASVVAPLARKTSVLMLVLDGLTWSIAQEIVESLDQRGWTLLTPTGAPVLQPVISVLPTTTEVCRATLLCGALSRGTSDIERSGFASHPGLVAASKLRFPPKLFHKGQLSADAPDQLAQDVREAIASKDIRIVGVVVNAVDDYLHKNDQGRPRWTLDYLPALGALLYEARQAARVVVLTSDHGHVLDAEEVLQADDQSADRWRTMGVTPPDVLELAFSGPRVADLASTWRIGGARDTERRWVPGTIVMPWSERVRYGSRKNGYHGGATPQEVIVPLLVLAPTGLDVAGYDAAVLPVPNWWDPTVAAPAPAAAPPAPAPVRRPPRTLLDIAELPPESPPEAPPFAPSPAGPDWLPALLSSPVYQAQRAQTARLGLDDERVAALLGALVERGGRMTRAALAQRLGVAPVRIAGMLAALRRLLNVDGIAVIDVDEAETVILNVALLRVQFELP